MAAPCLDWNGPLQHNPGGTGQRARAGGIQGHAGLSASRARDYWSAGGSTSSAGAGFWRQVSGAGIYRYSSTVAEAGDSNHHVLVGMSTEMVLYAVGQPREK